MIEILFNLIVMFVVMIPAIHAVIIAIVVFLFLTQSFATAFTFVLKKVSETIEEKK